MSIPTDHITVLGGGPAGLATALAARRRSLGVQLYEASSDVGGNCRTLEHGGHRFDTGAHRLHDRIPSVTREFRALLGDEMISVDAPSAICLDDRMLNFPLAPLDVIRNLPVSTVMRIAGEILLGGAGRRRGASDFREYAVGRYGPTLAGKVLLGYTEKLWGLPASELAADVAGGRVKGLDLMTFLRELIPGGRAARRHLDGRFYYPRRGIGQLAERMVDAIGPGVIHTDSRVTSLRHDGAKICAVEVNGNQIVDVAQVVNTLPLPLTLRLLDPAPSAHLLEIAGGMRFRSLLLVVLAVGRNRLSHYASIYFPDREVPFTRLYEPKNRSSAMGPDGTTALVVEIPCMHDEPIFTAPPGEVVPRVVDQLAERGLIAPDEVLSSALHRIPNAYPMLSVEQADAPREMLEYLAGFTNLHMSGRNALFRYAHIHDMFDMAFRLVDSLERGADVPARYP